MLDESTFETIAGATLMHCHDQLEEAYGRGEIDELELQEGVLTIRTGTGATLIVSRHAPSRQVWLASPLSGGLHFSYAPQEQCWRLADGRTLYGVLREDLAKLDVEVVL
jgi:frataxin